MNVTPRPHIAVIGGTGKLGHALARRWAKAGYPVLLGSRDPQRAESAAEGIRRLTPGADVRGCGNLEAARTASIVVVSVPSSSQTASFAEIREVVQGKLVVDTTVPLVPPKVMRVQLPPEGCAALRAQAVLGPGVTLTSAFHNVAAHRLETDEQIDCDVLVFGDDKDARERVCELACGAGLRGLHAGSLANSAAAEALTSVLIFVNKHYAADGAGIRITGTAEKSEA